VAVTVAQADPATIQSALLADEPSPAGPEPQSAPVQKGDQDHVHSGT
jgi:hypothetical protein